jgi:hypothetical protein
MFHSTYGEPYVAVAKCRECSFLSLRSHQSAGAAIRGIGLHFCDSVKMFVHLGVGCQDFYKKIFRLVKKRSRNEKRPTNGEPLFIKKSLRFLVQP